MYLIGTPHPHKHDAQRLLEEAVSRKERLVTSAEVLQEILNRYRAIDRPGAIQDAFDVLDGAVDEVLPVDAHDVAAARDVLLARWSLSARDALHVAVMHRHGIDRIMTFDQAFASVPGIALVA
jgi:predicted nucleic acid-binding protein